MTDEEAVGLAVAGGISLFFILISLVIAIFFLLTLSRTLAAVSDANRQMEPGMVWLNLIPLFNLGWIFIPVIKLGDSLVREAADRSLEFGDGGKALGIAYGALIISSFIPFIGILTGLAGLVVFILYWVKIAGYKNQLFQPA